MKRYALYDGDVIASIFTGFESQVAIQGRDYVELPKGDDATHYIKNGVPMPKIEWDCDPIIDDLKVTLTGVPDGTTGTVEGVTFDASGDTEIEFDRLGAHTIRLSPPAAYVEKKVEVTLHG